MPYSFKRGRYRPKTIKLTTKDLTDLTTTLSNLPSSITKVVLPAGTITEPVTVPAGLAIEGTLAGQKVDASTPLTNATIFSNTVTFEGDVSLDGVVLTAAPRVDNANNITITSSIVKDIDTLLTDKSGNLGKAVIAIG